MIENISTPAKPPAGVPPPQSQAALSGNVPDNAADGFFYISFATQLAYEIIKRWSGKGEIYD